MQEPPAMSGLSTAAIRTLECRAFNAWPALQTVIDEGWLLRFARGHTKRANSVNVLWPGDGTDLVRRVARAEALYRALRLPPVFRVTPLAEPGLDAALAARGYEAVDPSLVLAADIASLAGDFGLLPAPAPDPFAGWLDAFGSATQADAASVAALGDMLRVLVPPAGFVRVPARDGGDGAYAMGVLEAGDLGVFEVLTVPEARRQGLAAKALAALAAWAIPHGARRAYLQVAAENAPARSLYARLGFREIYRYHYRRAP
jgi:GNAT superfamily N-acetyltransferase